MWVDPLPCEAGDLPCRGSSHEFTMKKRKNEIGAGAGQVGRAVVPGGGGRGRGGGKVGDVLWGPLVGGTLTRAPPRTGYPGGH